MNYAGFWRRSIAVTLDTIVLGGVYALLDVFLKLDFAILSAIYYAIAAAYYIAMTSSKYQGTLGQMIMNIKIGDIARYRLSISQSSFRYILSIVPMIPVMYITITPYFGELMSTMEQAENLSPEELQAYFESPSVIEQTGKAMLVSTATCILSLIWFLPIAFTKEKTGLHDLISKQRAFNMSEQ